MQPLKSRCTAHQNGAVLMLVLLVITILASVVIQSMRVAQIDQAGAYVFRNGVQARSLAFSGVRIARALLWEDLRQDKEDQKQFDHPGEEWALFPENMENPLEWETGSLKGQVLDEQGRFPINVLAAANGTSLDEHEKTLRNLFQGPLFNMKEKPAKELVTALRDWLDKDDSSTDEAGAEKKYYKEKGLPVLPPNSAVQNLDELRDVRGMTEDIFEGSEGKPGFKDLISTLPFSKVNINSAGPFLLQALARDVDQDAALEIARAMIEFRRDKWHHDLLDRSDWYREVAVYGAAFVTFPGTARQSRFFRVRSSGICGGIGRSCRAVLEREKSYDEKKGPLQGITVLRLSMD